MLLATNCCPVHSDERFSTMTGQYPFLKNVNKLQPELHAALDRINDLDRTQHELSAKAFQAMMMGIQAYCREVANGRTGPQAELDRSLQLAQQAVDASCEKVNGAKNLYQQVEKQTRYVDKQLALVRDEIQGLEENLGISSALPNHEQPGSTFHFMGAAPLEPAPSGKGSSKRKSKKQEAAPAAVVQPAIPDHFVPFTFKFPGREPHSAFVDPNEPNYCFCQQPSWGDMIGCDSDTCKYEWFHYPCVGVTDESKKKWYCPDCAQKYSTQKPGKRKR